MHCLRSAAVLCAALMTVLCAGCAEGSDSAADSKNNSSAASTAENKSVSKSDEKDTDSMEDDSSEEVYDVSSTSAGRGLTQAYEFLQNESYSMNVRYTNADGEVTEIYRVVDGDNYYQRQKNSIGESGSIKVGDEKYDFDIVCGIYRKSSADRLDSVVETIVEENLPKTSTHIAQEDAEIYDVEEYTYTGDTYITVMDFCFDKQTGELVKYTTTYSVEGEDDVTEVREFYDLIPSAPVKTKDVSESSADGSSEGFSDSSAADESSVTESSANSYDVSQAEIDASVFDVSFIQGLADFANMTEERRLGYCQAIFVTAGVTADELDQAGYDDTKLKTISYDDFVSLVYTYGYN